LDNPVTFAYLLRVVLRYWVLIGAVFVLAVAASIALTLRMPPVYESTAVILVKLGRESIYRPTVGSREAIVSRDRDAIINAEVQILRSRELIESVVTEIGPDVLYPNREELPTPVEAAVGSFYGGLVVEVVPGADVLRVSFRHTEPEMTARVVNVLVERFKEKHLEVFSDPRATAFLEEKVAEYRSSLEDAEQRTRQFRAANQSYFAEQQEGMLIQEHQALESSRKEAQNQIAGLGRKLTFLESQKDAAAAGPGEQNRVISEAKAKLLDLRLQEQQLLTGYKESNRQVANVREQIRILNEFLEEQQANAGLDGFQQQLELDIVKTMSDLRYQQAKAANIERQQSDLERKIRSFPQLDKTLRGLRRERDALEESYQTYLKRLEEARISEEMDRQKIANISVIQEGAVPRRPILPRKRVNVAVGMFLGAATGLGLAFVIDAVRRTT
jgi:uncharacterized protein involved in exopolysaccharide biosynthesis